MTKIVGIDQKSGIKIQEIIPWIKAGDEVILTENSKPLARLIPMEQSSIQRTPGLHAGSISTSPDFDEPLPDEFLGPSS